MVGPIVIITQSHVTSFYSLDGAIVTTSTQLRIVILLLLICCLLLFFRRCNCNYEGSLITNCDASGQCKCKDDVIGKQCNKCKPSYFDLETNNPKGCKACFCYGHGISCKALDSSGLHGGIGKRVIKSSFETDFDGWKLEDEYGRCNSFSPQNLKTFKPHNLETSNPFLSFCLSIFTHTHTNFSTYTELLVDLKDMVALLIIPIISYI